MGPQNAAKGSPIRRFCASHHSISCVEYGADDAYKFWSFGLVLFVWDLRNKCEWNDQPLTNQVAVKRVWGFSSPLAQSGHSELKSSDIGVVFGAPGKVTVR